MDINTGENVNDVLGFEDNTLEMFIIQFSN